MHAKMTHSNEQTMQPLHSRLLLRWAVHGPCLCSEEHAQGSIISCVQLWSHGQLAMHIRHRALCRVSVLTAWLAP